LAKIEEKVEDAMAVLLNNIPRNYSSLVTNLGKKESSPFFSRKNGS
jgi:hypothetical protein